MKHLIRKIISSNSGFQKLLEEYKAKTLGEVCSLQGLSGSSVSIMIAGFFEEEKKLNCVILPDKESASYMYDDLVNCIGDEYVLFFPSAYKRSVEYLQTDSTNIVLKTEVLNKLCNTRKPHVIVTYPGAIIEKVMPAKELRSCTLEIRTGDVLSMQFVIDVLEEYDFRREDFVYEPGTYSVRGSIIDVFSFGNEKPFRIDFFGDEVDSIRSFDSESQLSVEKFSRIAIVPNIHESVSTDNNVSFFDFIGANCRFWISNPEMIRDKIDSTYKAAKIRYNEFLENPDEKTDDDNIVVLNPETHLIDAEMVFDEIKKFRVFEIAARTVFENSSKFVFNINPQPKFGKNFDLLINNINDNSSKDFQTYILSDNEKQIQRLKDIFLDKSANLEFYPILKSLHKGFIDNDSGICVYTDHEIFERYHAFKTRVFSRKDAINIQELTALRPGDYVVHIDNGIGKFGGLQKIKNDGKVQEVISIIYDNNDILYVNIHSLHRISKYRDKDGEPPKIHRLGSGHWKRLKEKTKKNVKDIAKDLIVLYAQRREKKGFAFSPDTYIQHELETSFIYEDTPDQQKATESIKMDMESETPMDRLICGDVGFGKTELAIRAAVKAVCDGKQVAVLVPTTILALQHYQTFKDRLQNLPVSVSYISRLRSSKEIKNALQNLKEGKLDIIIGTHRLVNKDVEFKDLGLLVVDEEQKFGVAIKEKLRQMKVDVDTLIMTATPIPRTLQFSMMGARDLSIINTPPPNRQPIITELHSFNNDIIQEAIYYEVGRNGQVFFINNRIQNIYEVESLINHLCPEVKIVVAHGQMDPKKLEKTILEFMRGDFDVLICTTIIENGVDIPNANTIIINNANNFGLSDLHQLRGRVGRSNKKAFCYLLAPPLSTMTTEARRRLKAIEEFSELGSGMNIALQDLDIRGAGNILGSEQSGFIADVGFETFNKILNEAVAELKENEFRDLFHGVEDEKSKQNYYTSDCLIETDYEVLIPADYVRNTSERIRLYKEIDELKTEKELNIFKINLEDRFGEIPEETIELFSLVRLRWLAMELGFQKLVVKNKVFIGYFPFNNQSPYYSSKLFGKIIEFVQSFPKDFMMKEHKEKLTLRFRDAVNLDTVYYRLTEIDRFVKMG